MKKLSVVFLVAFAVIGMFGCGLKVEGVFFDSQDSVVYQGEVSPGEQVNVGYRGYATVHISGLGISRDDVKVTPLIKGCCGPETVIVSTGGLAVGAIVWAIVGADGCQSGFDYDIGPIEEDMLVTVGDDFSFTLVGDQPEPEGEVDFATVPNLTGLTEAQARTRISSTCLIVGNILFVDSSTIPAGYVVSWSPTGRVMCGATINIVVSTGPVIEGEIEGELEGEVVIEGEIEGEPVIEGEIEGEPIIPLSVIIVSPASLATVTKGGTINMIVSVNGENPLELTLVAPRSAPGDVFKQNITPPRQVSHSFVMDIEGTGNLTARVRDLVTGQTADASRPVVVNPVGNMEEGEIEGEIEGEVPRTSLVPNVVGMTQANALSAIQATCLVVGNLTQSYSSTVPLGSVISSNPAAGVTANCGTAINLVISLGPEPLQTGVVPSLAGMTQSDATSALQTNCLAVGSITESYSSTVALGRVISSTPGAGVSLTCGSLVALVLSKGPVPTAVFGLTVSSPSDGAIVADRATVIAQITGPNPVDIVVVSPDGQVYRVNGVTPTYNLSHEFVLEIAGTGLFTVRVTDTVTQEVLERTRAVTVTL